MTHMVFLHIGPHPVNITMSAFVIVEMLNKHNELLKTRVWNSQ